ncbi:MAG: DUF2339 domain-containing protein [Chryseolinea sp.]
MEFFLLLALIVILVLILTLKNSLTSKIELLHHKMDFLTEELKRRTSLKEEVRKEEVKVEKKSTLEEITIQHKAPVIIPEPIKPKEETLPAFPTEKKEEIKKSQPIHIYPENRPPVSRPVQSTPPIIAEPKPPQPGFFERNPDLEKFIGENLANKIGIGILVLGIGFFVKYAIDQDWINEIGRVFIGILCGGILLGVAHRLRKTFTAFSSVLVGGGIAVLYLTITIAFHEYKIFNQTAAFLLMLGITSFAVVLSLGYNRIELAVLSILGGFASPFMVSTGEGNYVVLFTYILILDSGMLVLAYFKKWNLVNIICYALTILLFGSWMSTKFDGENSSMIVGALIFATLFYLIFFAMNIVNNIKERLAFKGIEISILLSNTFFFYGAGMVILDNPIGENFKGLFTATLGIFNFIFAYALYKNNRVDKNLVFLLIGLVLTFISLAAPVQLKGNYITLFWSAETVLLLWLSQKSGIRLMKLASLLIMGLMVISLIMDWSQIYIDADDLNLTILLNKGYITSLFALGSIAATVYLLKNENRKEDEESVLLYKMLLLFAGVLLLYTSQFLELRHQLYHYGFEYSTQNIIIGTYNMLFVLGLLLCERRWISNQQIKDVFSFWGIAAMLAYLFYYHNQTVSVRNDFLFSDIPVTGFVFHYLLISILILISFISLKKIQTLDEFNKSTFYSYSWFYVFFFVFLASAELDHIVMLLSGATSQSMEHTLTQNHKIGYPILWGITSFILIAIGLKTKKKHLRIIALTLFLITILKLFTLDIRGISEGGKIAAFISLGVLLLIVSFMYQRLKKILLADEPVRNEPEKENPQ